MKKRIMTDILPGNSMPTASWLDVAALAEVEITSEDSDYPIEAALLPNQGRGWRAGYPGTQTIRLIFTHPQELRRIMLSFSESAVLRTQEFVLRWSGDRGQTFHEIVRQQWNFSPDGSTLETEEYTVAISAATTLELVITPDIGSQGGIASLDKFRIT